MTQSDPVHAPPEVTLPTLPYGLVCYLVPAAAHTVEGLRSLLKDIGGAGAWLSVREVTVRERPWLAVALQALKDVGVDGGVPVALPDLAGTLSRGGQPVVHLLMSAGAEQALLGLYREGKQVRAPEAGPLPRSDDPAVSLLDPTELKDLPEILELGAVQCGEGCEVVHRGGCLSVPGWTMRHTDIFRFSERTRHGLTEDDGSDGGLGGRLCLLALDLPRLRKDMARRSVGAVLHVLQTYTNPEARRFLGPMVGDLPPVLDELRRMETNLHVRKARAVTDVAELLALVHTRLSTPGHRAAYLDQVFFPLLSLHDDPVPPALDPDELDAIDALDVCQAMADQLPYHAPEGELLESFGDDELTPLCRVLDLDDEGGAVWLLRPDRLQERLDAFVPEAFREVYMAFYERWWQALGAGSEEAKMTWLKGRFDRDVAALDALFTGHNEMRTLLHMARLNDLTPALLFYE